MDNPPRKKIRLTTSDYQKPLSASVTIRTYKSCPYFVDDQVALMAIKVPDKLAREFGWNVPAFCFMPNHVHLFVESRSPNNFLAFINRFKQVTGFRFRQIASASPKEAGVTTTDLILWHRSYMDQLVRTQESKERLIDYIMDNPVKAGLVDKSEDYPYSGSII